MKSSHQKLLLISTIILLVFARLLPHPPNFTPLGGIAILGGCYFGKSYLKYLIPLIAFYISDLLVSNLLFKSFYPDQSFVFFSSHMIWNYIAIIIIVFISTLFLKNKNFKNILGTSLAGAVVFFIISNFGTWMAGTMYSKDFSGLMTCYFAGLPFLHNTVSSFVLFSAAGYGIIEYGHQLLGKKVLS
ncbi:DUF6580 family putative transport protein [Membranihabitans maritimus]|uniref:DUF6580 family putative transport protein n=1 Tax=Membranihabitans maritimus TaxID=2904244 RepID=UPI001F355E4D|nr:DUF6580 family putative transport protein [Membranihabitans maritimus]